MQKILEQRLQETFSPSRLEIIDDSDKHKGHVGSQGGARHFTVIIKAECFQDLSRVKAHRMIYDVLNDLIPHKIHALQIKILDQ